MSSPKLLHQRVLGDLFVLLHGWTGGTTGSGEVFLPLAIAYETSVLIPDLLWFAQAPDNDDGPADHEPNLLVEVRSVSTWHYDLGRKRELYLQHGVPELWLVDIVERRVIVHRGDESHVLGADELLTSPQLPGFEVRVGDLIPAGS
jgi:Uma2 family endonuclease